MRFEVLTTVIIMLKLRQNVSPKRRHRPTYPHRAKTHDLKNDITRDFDHTAHLKRDVKLVDRFLPSTKNILCLYLNKIF
jgi:hypothetical protein